MPYSIEQLRTAYQKAKAAGDEAGASTLWNALIQTRMASEATQYDPTEGMSGLEKFRAGVGQGIVNVGRHAGNFVGLVPDEALADAKQTDAALLRTGAGRAGSFVGELAATAPLTMGGVGLAAKSASLAKTLANPITRGVAEGTLQGAVMGDPGERGAPAVLGGLAGGILPSVATIGGKLAKGVTRTPEAQALLDRGVDLTPGQMNPGSVLSHLEEAWQDVPVVGSVVRGARSNAQQSFSKALAQEVSAPGATVAGRDIHQMLDAAYKSFEPLYDQAKGFPVRPYVMTNTGTDVPLSTLFKRAAGNQSVRATTDTRKSVSRYLRNQLSSGVGSSDDLLKLRSSVRAEIRKARLSGDASESAAADLLSGAEQSITEALESQLPADAMAALRTADGQYGKYKILEDAVARSGDQPQGLSPAQLSAAVKAATEKGAYARGGGRLRDMASAGRQVFNQTQPATGARLAAIGIPISIGAAEPITGGAMAAGLGGLVGTQTGRRLAAGTTKPQQIAQALMGRYDNAIAEPYRELLAQYLRRGSVTAALAQEP